MWGGIEANPQKMGEMPLRRQQVALLHRAGSTVAPGPFPGGGAAVPLGDRRGRCQDGGGVMPHPSGHLRSHLPPYQSWEDAAPEGEGESQSHTGTANPGPRLPDSQSRAPAGAVY